MTNALTGIDIIFGRWNGSSWDELADINALIGLSDRSVIEATPLNSEKGYAEFITGFLDGGTLALNMDFTRAGYEVMKQDFEANVIKDYRIVFPDENGTTLAFDGLVTEIPIISELEDRLKANVMIKAIGEVSLGEIWGIDSAIVDDTDRNAIVMTFLTAQPDLTAEEVMVMVNDEEVLVTSAFWAGSVWTLYLDSDCDYADEIEVTNIEMERTTCVTNNISYPSVIEDGHTIAWYDSSYGASITKDAMNSVSKWADKLGSGNDVEQDAGASQPLWSEDGVLFDGINDVLKSGSISGIAQPMQVYIVFKQVSWHNNDYIFDGDASQSMGFCQSTNINRIWLIAPTKDISYLADADTFMIARILFNGEFSSLTINNETSEIGGVGSNNGGGITLGRIGGSSTNYSNVQIKEILFRDVEDASAVNTELYNYLAAKYGFETI